MILPRTTHDMATIREQQIRRDLLAELAEWQRATGPERARWRNYARASIRDWRAAHERTKATHAAWMRDELRGDVECAEAGFMQAAE